MWNFHDVSMSTRVKVNSLEHIFVGALFVTHSLWLYDICVSWSSWYFSCRCNILRWLNRVSEMGFQFEAQHMQSENNEVPFSSGMNHHRRNARPQISYVNLSYVHKYLHREYLGWSTFLYLKTFLVSWHILCKLHFAYGSFLRLSEPAILNSTYLTIEPFHSISDSWILGIFIGFVQGWIEQPRQTEAKTQSETASFQRRPGPSPDGVHVQ